MTPAKIAYEDGWSGAFTRAQADGAYPNGSRIIKCQIEKGDSHEVGARATVLGSLRLPDGLSRDLDIEPLAYFVEWDTHPRQACLVVASKIRRADGLQ